MRRLALGFAGSVVVVVAALNVVDARYPGGLRSLISSEPSPPQPPAQPGAQSANIAPAQPSEPAPVANPVSDFAAESVQALWPGSRIDRVVYGARPYENMTVVSISAQAVLLKNEREIVSIPTASLPEDLRSLAAAYLTGADGPPYARKGNPAFPPLPPAAPKPQPAEAAPQEEAATPVVANPAAVAWAAARDRAEWWLRYERERRITDIVPLVTGVDMGSALPVDGFQGYWRVRGRGYVATYQETKGGTFHDFEITIVLDSEGNVLRADFKLL